MNEQVTTGWAQLNRFDRSQSKIGNIDIFRASIFSILAMYKIVPSFLQFF